MNYLRLKLSQANDKFDIDTNEDIINGLISPIPRNYTDNHVEIYEEHPSCGYRMMEDGTEVFKDLTDDNGIGYDEIKLIKQLEELNVMESAAVKSNYQNGFKNIVPLFNNLPEPSKEFINNLVVKYGFSEKVIKTLKLRKEDGNELTEFIVPTINNGVPLALGYYHPSSANGSKWHYTKGQKGSLIVGFDDWKYNYKDITLICEGQKDMLIAKSLGYNAICFTNGSQAIPKLYKKYFKDRDIAIAYDNDKAGFIGADKLAVWLKDIGAKSIKIIKEFHNVLDEKGDIWDYFFRLKKTKEDFDEIIENTSIFTKTEYNRISESILPLMTLNQAKAKDNLNKVVQSDVQIVSESSIEYIVPDYVQAYLYGIDKKSGIEEGQKGDFKVQTPKDYLYLIQDEIKQTKYLTQKMILEDGTYASGKYPLIKDKRVYSRETIYMVDVEQISDVFADELNISSSNTTAYCIGKKPIVGKKYRIKYKMLAHPLEDSKLVIIIDEFQPYDDFTQSFELTDKLKKALKVFQPQAAQSVKDKMWENYQDMKAFIGTKLEWDVWAATDLVFNSALKMNWGGRDTRATLDAAIIGDAGIGKSFAFDKLYKLYKQGAKVSAENATTISIIGGSTSRGGTGKGYKTTAGELARQDKGLIFFEEVGSLATELASRLNEVRSEGRGTVHRIDGNLHYDASLRYLFVGNQKSEVQQMSFNKTGMIPITEMFPKPEQRRRFDFILTTGSKTDPYSDDIDMEFDNFGFTPTLPYPEEYYESRLKWIWSRKSENIIITPKAIEAGKKCAIHWWDNYWTKEALFGTDKLQTMQKLTRIAIAVAGMLYSTKDGVNIIVTEEHMNWAYYEFWIKIYDSKLFKIKDYSKEVTFTRKVTKEDTEKLQKIYEGHAVLIDELYKTVEPSSKTMLEVYYGKDKDSLTQLLNQLLKLGFLEVKKEKYDTTAKFKGCYQHINKVTKETQIKEDAIWDN